MANEANVDMPTAKEIIKSLGNSWRGLRLDDESALLYLVTRILLAIDIFLPEQPPVSASPAEPPKCTCIKEGSGQCKYPHPCRVCYSYHPGVSCYFHNQGKTPADKRSDGRTFLRSDGSLGCDECCNGDRCDDPTHRDRENCSYCLGSGFIEKPVPAASPVAVDSAPPKKEKMKLKIELELEYTTRWDSDAKVQVADIPALGLKTQSGAENIERAVKSAAQMWLQLCINRGNILAWKVAALKTEAVAVDCSGAQKLVGSKDQSTA